MWSAFPTSDYYGPSAPFPGHQQTACLAAPGLADREGGDPRTVPTFTADRSTGSVPSFSPAGLSTTTPQSFIVAPDDTNILPPRPSLPVVSRFGALPTRPSTRFPAGPDFLRGFHHWFLHSYTSPSRLPNPGCLAVPARPGVVEAAPTLPRTSGIRLPPASAACCDRPKVGTFPPLGHTAPRGAPSQRSPRPPPRAPGRPPPPPRSSPPDCCQYAPSTATHHQRSCG